MPIDDHMEGFELNKNYKEVFGDISEYYPGFKYRQLYEAIEKIAPDYIAAAHVMKDCRRNLRYIGRTWNEDELPADDEFFKLGKMYVGTSFNGATYTVEGYGERPIGCAYFDWVKEV